MKKIILLLMLVAGGIALAQTNTPKKAPRAPTEIDSDAADFDLSSRLAVYRGHVVVTDPEMTLQCDRLLVFLPAEGDRLNHIEAQTNVVIKFYPSHGDAATATGSLAVYRFTVQNGYTNETVTLTGKPRPQIQSKQGIVTGSKITWNRASNGVHIDDPKMISKQNLNESFGTNAASAKLF